MTWVVSKVHECSSRLKEIIEKTTYTINEDTHNYSYISEEITNELLEDSSFENDKLSYKFKTAYWSKCFEYIVKHSDSVNEINKVLNKQEKILSREMFNKVTNQSSENHDREFVFNHLLETLS